MKSYTIFQKNWEKEYLAQGQACDMCGSNDASVKKQSTDYICLCSKCSNYIETLPIYSKGCIERFLMGNIL